MAYLRPDPQLFDVEGWRQRLAELRADLERDPGEAAATLVKIEYARAHLAAISGTPPETAAEGGPAA